MMGVFRPRIKFGSSLLGQSSRNPDSDSSIVQNALLCAAALLVSLCAMMPFSHPAVAFAAATTGVAYNVEVKPSFPVAGEEVVLTFSLDNYDEATSDGIQALQIDVEGLDPAVVGGVSCSSLIEDKDDDVFTNKGTFSKDNERARLAYVKHPGTLAKSCGNVFELRFTLLDTLLDSGTLVLSVTFLAETESGVQTEISQTCEVDYLGSSSLNTVQVSWGAFDFVYTEGLWDPATHTAKEGSWSISPSGSNVISVKSLMSGTSTIGLSFTPAEEFLGIGCAFFSDEACVAPLEKLSLACNEERSVWLLPNGILPKNANGSVIGSVTVTLEDAQ